MDEKERLLAIVGQLYVELYSSRKTFQALSQQINILNKNIEDLTNENKSLKEELQGTHNGTEKEG